MNDIEYDIESDFLSLLVNYQDFILATYIKVEYLENNKYSLFYKIIREEYNKNKSLVIENLVKNYPGFDLDLFINLFNNNLYHANRNNAFKTIQETILENYKKRQTKIVIENFNGNLDETLQQLENINNLDSHKSEYIKLKDMYETLNVEKTQVKLGYATLDYNLNLSKHDLLILAAGTGCGKTAFALNILNNISSEYQCVYFNMEMSKNILYKRLLALRSDIEIKELNDFKNLNNNQKQIIHDEMKKIEEKQIILFNNSYNIRDIRREIATIQTKRHMIVFLDHIGLIKSSGNSLYEKMTNIAKELRSISIDYDCTIIALCQLSRESQKQDREPLLQDLRDSGEVEQSARKVIMLYNTTKDEKQRVRDMKVKIMKNDDGNLIDKMFKFDKYTQKFEENFNEPYKYKGG